MLANFGFDQGWRVDKHPRFVTNCKSGFGDIVGCGDAGVWTALVPTTVASVEARFVLANLGIDQGWRVDKHPRFVAPLRGGRMGDLVGFGDAGVWTALSRGDGGFEDAKFVLANFGVDQGWRVDQHPRFVTDLTGDGRSDVFGFGDAGVWTAVGNGDGGLNESALRARELRNRAGMASRPSSKAPRPPGQAASTPDIVGFGDAAWTARDGQGGFLASTSFSRASATAPPLWR